MPLPVPGHGKVSLSKEGTLGSLLLVGLNVNAVGHGLNHVRISQKSCADSVVFGVRIPRKACLFWGLVDRWEQGAE